MSNKTFVSLCFYQNKLQILQLDITKSKAVMHASVELPSGIIQNHHVIDQAQLVEILQKTWNDLRLTERLVGIVVPEFSTFTKSIFLPRIDVDDLDEAVRWQSQDFMPAGTKDVIMDWKVVKKSKESYQILAVAMPKDVLSGYVDSASKAGLYPLVVETPSLSLERIIDEYETGKLIIYTNSGEAVLVFVRGREIIGSSVVESGNQDGILSTASNMAEHYRDTKIQNIFVGGTELTDKLLKDLSRQFSVQPKWINPDIGGLSAKDVQEYLVPLSLQKKDPAEPKDESTINLLPDTWVHQYEKKRFLSQAWMIMIVLSVFIWSSLIASVVMYFYLDTSVRTLEQNSGQVSLPGTVSKEVNSINQISEKTVKVFNTLHSPQNVIDTINNAIVSGITLNEYRFNLDVGSVTVRGIAKTRQSLVDFRTTLDETEEFSSIQIPLSFFEEEADIEFSVTFSYGSEKTKPIKLQI